MARSPRDLFMPLCGYTSGLTIEVCIIGLIIYYTQLWEFKITIILKDYSTAFHRLAGQNNLLLVMHSYASLLGISYSRSPRVIIITR